MNKGFQMVWGKPSKEAAKQDVAEQLSIISPISRISSLMLNKNFPNNSLPTNHYSRKCAAFTLAETLITLGIIGVVATLTLPNLTANYQRKVLEAQFKKAYNSIVNAASYAEVDEQTMDSTGVDFAPAFMDTLKGYYKSTRTPSATEISTYKSVLKNYTKDKKYKRSECSQYPAGTSFVTNDNTFYAAGFNCGKLWITFDVNGLKKGPNAFGHDIFAFKMDSGSSDITPVTSETEVAYDEDGNSTGYNHSDEVLNKCSKNSKSEINGVTCAQYAIGDECPDDNTKGYWECLP